MVFGQKPSILSSPKYELFNFELGHCLIIKNWLIVLELSAFTF